MKRFNILFFVASLLFSTAIIVVSPEALSTSQVQQYKGGIGNIKSAISEVKIGNQIWMAHNLNVERFRNGEKIPQAKTDQEWEAASENKQPVWSYYQYQSKNGQVFGKLYNWYAVNDSRGIAPAGYHIPTQSEWQELIQSAGGDSVAGKQLKSELHWIKNGIGSNAYGFNALPGGSQDNHGGCQDIGEMGSWWSSSVNGETQFVWIISLSGVSPQVNTLYYPYKGAGFSIRCIKD